MPVAEPQSEILSICMVVFSLDNWITNLATVSHTCMVNALKSTGHGEDSIINGLPDIKLDSEAKSPKEILQALSKATAFPRTKIELVLKQFDKLFKASLIERKLFKIPAETKAALTKLTEMNMTIGISSMQTFGTALALLQTATDVKVPFDFIFGCDNVRFPPPSPEIGYRFCLNDGLSPKQVLFVDSMEDGVTAAIGAGCFVFNSPQYTAGELLQFIADKNQQQGLNPLVTKWQQRITVLFFLDQYPDHFLSTGYGYPGALTHITYIPSNGVLAPLVDIHGSSMCQTIVKNLNLDQADIVFVINKKTYDRYNFKFFLESVGKKEAKIVTYDFDGPPESFKYGATLLQAKEHIKTDQPVLVVSCSQFLEWDSNAFLYTMANPVISGGILTFNSTHPRYGFVKLGAEGWLEECAINAPISKHATAGIFYWKTGELFCKYTEAAVKDGKDGPTKAACLHAYTKALAEQNNVRTFECRRVWELSSNKDLEVFLKMKV